MYIIIYTLYICIIIYIHYIYVYNYIYNYTVIIYIYYIYIAMFAEISHVKMEKRSTSGGIYIGGTTAGSLQRLGIQAMAISLFSLLFPHPVHPTRCTALCRSMQITSDCMS